MYSAKRRKGKQAILEEEKKLIPTNVCNNSHCPSKAANEMVPDSKLKTCAGCRITWYCSEKCQKEDWSARHKLTCTRLPDKQVQWIGNIRQHMAMLKNNKEMCRDMFRDAQKEYLKDFDPVVDANDKVSVCRRGVLCIDLSHQTHETNVIPDGVVPDKVRSALEKKRAEAAARLGGAQDIEFQAFVYKYLCLNDAAIQEQPDNFRRIISLMNKYDPDKQFVVMIMCSDDGDASTGAEQANISEIISVDEAAAPE